MAAKQPADDGVRASGRPARKKPTRLGKLPPRYWLVLNQYEDVRFTTCPKCDGKTKLRKMPLLIHVDPHELINLNKSVRFCPYCELVIVHQDELEAQLAYAFEQRGKPEVIGNPYVIIGTMDRADWLKGRTVGLSMEELFGYLHDFKGMRTVHVEPGGWRRADPDEPPPPPSKSRKSR